MPHTNPEETFEDLYINKFEGLLIDKGTIINHKRDRFATDMGLHLTVDGIGSQSRVWFQLKGKHRDTLTKDELQSSESVSIDVQMDHLKFWYASPEAVYLVVYLEATDEFIGEDVRDIVERQWGIDFLSPRKFKDNQQSVTIKINRNSKFNEDVVKHLTKHRSMRIDGPLWRGRPLGHRIDPLRTALSPLNPTDYFSLVKRLLEVHGFIEKEKLDATILFPHTTEEKTSPYLLYGIMNQTYEWTHPLFTEFGYSPNSDFRIEGQMFRAQGKCLVLIDHIGNFVPPNNVNWDNIKKKYQIENFLVFINKPQETQLFGSYRGFGRTGSFECIPQDLDSLAFNVLTATSIYLEFQDKINFRYINYL